MNIIKGPCGYSTRLVCTLGKLIFREILGESVPVGPRIGVFGAYGSASLPEIETKHRCCRGVIWVSCRVGGYPGKTRFVRETVGSRVWGRVVVLTMVEEGYDPSVAYERGQAQGYNPMGIIEGPCEYSSPLIGTQGKLVFSENLGESVPVGPRIGVFWACGSSLLSGTWAKHRGATHGCGRRAMLVPCRVGGYPGKNRF